MLSLKQKMQEGISMNKTELRHIAESLIEELREMPDGTEITSGYLLRHYAGISEELEFNEMFDYHESLFRAAKANHITLDMSKHDNKVEGLPWNLDFAVRNKKAQIKCPYCGSKNTARIIYGMPAFSDELQEKLDSGKIRLGGCCISGVPDEDGGMISLDPGRWCNDCHKKFAGPPYLVSKDRSSAEAYSDIVTGIRFSIFGYLSGAMDIELKKRPDGALVLVHSVPFGKEPVPDRHITNLRWMRLVNHLYNDLYLHEWNKSYSPEGMILDGEYWTLEISLTDRRKRTYRGSNAYPPYWAELKALFQPFMRK